MSGNSGLSTNTTTIGTILYLTLEILDMKNALLCRLSQLSDALKFKFVLLLIKGLL